MKNLFLIALAILFSSSVLAREAEMVYHRDSGARKINKQAVFDADDGVTEEDVRKQKLEAMSVSVDVEPKGVVKNSARARKANIGTLDEPVDAVDKGGSKK